MEKVFFEKLKTLLPEIEIEVEKFKYETGCFKLECNYKLNLDDYNSFILELEYQKTKYCQPRWIQHVITDKTNIMDELNNILLAASVFINDCSTNKYLVNAEFHSAGESVKYAYIKQANSIKEAHDLINESNCEGFTDGVDNETSAGNGMSFISVEEIPQDVYDILHRYLDIN